MLIRFFILLAFCLVSPAVFAADWAGAAKTGQPVELEADEMSYNRETGVYHASGDVHLIQGDLEVRSQSLEWNQDSGEIVAVGDVKLISPDEELSGDKARYNLQKGTGTVENGRFYLRESHLHVEGESIERRGEFDYRIINGTFTTCDGDVPSWKFGASQVDVTLGGYARARNTLFYLKDIPSLYFPYMIYPVKTERESGLLIPSLGYSTKRGFHYGAAYYQVLGINQDATLYLDYLSEMGWGKGVEYRYIFGQTNAGEMRFYHINVDRLDGESVDEERYAVEWLHDGQLPGGVRMVADVEYVNNNDYFEDFGDVAGEYNKDKVVSTFSLNKNWQKYSLTALSKYTKDLETDDKETLQLLPRITFDVNRERIAESPFYYAFATEYTHFWRQEGLRGERLMLQPLLAANVKLWDVIDIAPEATYLQRYYWGASDGSSSDSEGVAGFTTRVSTQLQRIYFRPFGSTGRLRHSFAPEVTYRYVPEVDQSRLPDFDSDDRIDKKNQLEYALVQRFTLRFDDIGDKPRYREFLYLRISQTYDMTDEAEGERFKDLRFEGLLLPTDWLSLKTDSTFDVNSSEWVKSELSGRIWDHRGNSLGLSYHYDPDKNPDDNVDYGSLDLSLAVFRPVYLRYQQRYDFATNEVLEHLIGVEFRQGCWSTLVTYRDREDDQSISVLFTMRGIGSVGGGGANLGGI